MTIAEANIVIKVNKDQFKRGIAQSKREFTKAADKMEKDAKRASLALVGIGAALAASFGLLTKTFITAGVEMEKMMKGLTAVAGSADEATKQLAELREVAKLPGLGLAEVVKASINLQAVRFSAEKATFFISEMGNALATVGKGRAELEGVIRGMQQMQSRGKVLAEEINQISERVPQFRAAMLDAFGTATSEEIQKMGITVEEFLTRTTRELGKLPRVAGGTANAIENLRDAWQQLATSLGEALLPAFTKIVDALGKVVEFLNKLTDTQKSILAWGTVIGTGVGLVATALGGLGLLLPGVTASLAAFAGVFGGLATVGLGPIGIGIAAIALAVTGLALAFGEFGKARKQVRLEDDLKALKGNISGIEAVIADNVKAIEQIEEAARKGAKEVSLLGTVLAKGGKVPVGGTELLPVEEQIERARARIARLVIELDFLRKTPKGIPGPKVEEAAAGLLSRQERQKINDLTERLKREKEIAAVQGAAQAREEEALKRLAVLRAVQAREEGGLPFLQVRAITERQQVEENVKLQESAARRIDDFKKGVDAESGARQKTTLSKFRAFIDETMKLEKERADRRDALAKKDETRRTDASELEIFTIADVIAEIEKRNKEASDKRIAARRKEISAIRDAMKSGASALRQVWTNLVTDIQSSFTNLFADLLSDNNLRPWEKFAQSIKNIFIRELSELAVSQAFRGLFALADLAERGLFPGRSQTSNVSPGPNPEDLFALGAQLGGGSDQAPGSNMAPGAINVVFPNADIEHMSDARMEAAIQRSVEPARRKLMKRGIIPVM